jgi:hypothetical protein
MKMASVFLRNNIVYLHAYSQTTQGAWIRWPPFLKVAWNDMDINDKLNELLQNVLEGSQKGVPHPMDWDLDDGFFQLANVKSWRQFAGGDCKLVDIELRTEDIRIISHEKRDKRLQSVNFVPYGDPITCRQTGRLDWKFWLSMAFERCK